MPSPSLPITAVSLWPAAGALISRPDRSTPTPSGAVVSLMSKKSPLTPAIAPFRANCWLSGVPPETLPVLT